MSDGFDNTKSIAETRFKLFNYTCSIAGAPLFARNISIVYAIYTSVISVCTTFLIMGLILDIYGNIDDLDRVTEDLMLILPFVMAVIPVISFRYRRDSVERLLHMTNAFSWNDLLDKHSVTGYSTMATWIPRLQKLMLLTHLTMISFQAAQTALHIITSKQRIFMFSVWYPFDIFESPYYELITISQIVAVVQIAGMFFSIPPFFGTLVSIACSQLEKLRANLTDLGMETEKSEGDECEEDEEELLEHDRQFEYIFFPMQKKLNQCVRHHQVILEYMNGLEEMFNPIFLGYFILMMIILCMSAVSAVSKLGDVVTLSLCIVVYGVMLATVFVLCWFGNKLTEMAESVRDAAFGCDWVGTTVPIQRSLIFIIAVANKEFALTAGKFVTVSKETMMNMIQESISLFMFMLQMREKNDDNL